MSRARPGDGTDAVGLTAQLADYIASASTRPLPPAALLATKQHVLDTVAAIVSGSRLEAGRAGAGYAAGHSGDGGSIIVARGLRCSPGHAALANAMAAHADESDDSHELSKSHPGCSIVPTALAIAQDRDCPGKVFLRAVAAGYDLGPRVNMACWPSFVDVRKERRGTPGISGMFGSATAAAVLAGLDPQRIRYLLSYTAQQVAGMNTWKRDVDHVEKAYVLGGFPAFGAVLALSLVEAGWTGVEDVFDGDPNFIEVVGKDPRPELIVEDLGRRFEVQRTHIKYHAVGSPAQAPIQALLHLMSEHQLHQDDIVGVRVVLPSVLAHTVQRSRVMSDINLLYLLSTVLEDGAFSFEGAHDRSRFEAWRARGGDSRIEVVADEGMEPRRQAEVEVVTSVGGQLSHGVSAVRGSPENPMSDDEVRGKAIGLMGPVVGTDRARQIADAVDGLDAAPDVDSFVALLATVPPGI